MNNYELRNGFVRIPIEVDHSIGSIQPHPLTSGAFQVVYVDGDSAMKFAPLKTGQEITVKEEWINDEDVIFHRSTGFPDGKSLKHHFGEGRAWLPAETDPEPRTMIVKAIDVSNRYETWRWDFRELGVYDWKIEVEEKE